VAAGDLRPRTYDIYELGLRLHVVPELGERRIRSLTPDDLVAWHRRRQADGYSPDAIHAWWTPLRLVLAHAVRRGGLDANPADKLLARERPKAGQSRKRFLTREEMERLLSAAPERHRLALTTGLFSGVRLGELLGLVWEDVDLAGEVVHVRAQLDRAGRRQQLKTAAARRDVVLMPRLSALLREHRVASAWSRADQLVFAAATGNTVGHRNLSARGLGKACARAGLEGVTFHALRHTFASLLIAQGHDPVFVSRQLGHANPAITLRVYSHLFDAARHADQARQGLEAQFRDLLV
jgi:integrase